MKYFYEILAAQWTCVQYYSPVCARVGKIQQNPSELVHPNG